MTQATIRFRVITWKDTWHIEDCHVHKYTPSERYDIAVSAAERLNKTDMSEDTIAGAFHWTLKPEAKEWQR